jgi:hypothetical protein
MAPLLIKFEGKYIGAARNRGLTFILEHTSARRFLQPIAAVLRFVLVTAAAFAQTPYPYYNPQPDYTAPQSYSAPPQSYLQQPAYTPQQPYPTQQQPYPTQQTYPPRPAPLDTGQQVLSPQQLDNLVAPIALYPDPLLSQVLAAATYPLEVVEAEQWVRQHSNLQGAQLVDAALQMNWDPSVQALVAFPDALAMLTRDVQWTTDLGNAFLAQQADVFAAIQRMRAAAEQNGRLQSTPQQLVTNEPPPAGQPGPGPIQIEPANPQVIYVPTYNPVYVWGSPAVGVYPALGYPSPGLGVFFGVASFIGSLFAGFLSFGGWGWGISWLTHTLFLNGLFLSHFGFGGFGGFGHGPAFARVYSARMVWEHNPAHRVGVPYSSRAVARRFSGSFGPRAAAGFGGYRGEGAYTREAPRSYASGGGEYRGGTGSQSYQGGAYERGAPGRTYSAPYNGAARPWGGYGGYTARAPEAPQYPARSFAPSSSFGQSFAPRGFSGAGAGHFSEPKSSGRFSAPHFSSPKFSSGGHSGGGHFGGGHFGGGGHSGGGRHSGGHHK